MMMFIIFDLSEKREKNDSVHLCFVWCRNLNSFYHYTHNVDKNINGCNPCNILYVQHPSNRFPSGLLEP